MIFTVRTCASRTAKGGMVDDVAPVSVLMLPLMPLHVEHNIALKRQIGLREFAIGCVDAARLLRLSSVEPKVVVG